MCCVAYIFASVHDVFNNVIVCSGVNSMTYIYCNQWLICSIGHVQQILIIGLGKSFNIKLPINLIFLSKSGYLLTYDQMIKATVCHLHVFSQSQRVGSTFMKAIK